MLFVAFRIRTRGGGESREVEHSGIQEKTDEVIKVYLGIMMRNTFSAHEHWTK